MNIFRAIAAALLVAVGLASLASCAEVPTYGAAPVISGVPGGYDTRKEEARGR